MIDAWKIGVSIAMTSNASQVLGVLGRDLFGLGQQAQALTGKLNAAKVAALGLMGVVGGIAGITVLTKLTEHGNKIQEQISKMKQANMPATEITQAVTLSHKMANEIPGTTPAENLAEIRDLRQLFGHMDEALAIAPEMAKLSVALGNAHNLPADKAEGEAFNFFKALDMAGALVNPVTGKIDPAHLESMAKLGEAIIGTYGDRFNSGMLLAFQKQAKVAGMLQTQEGLMNLTPLIVNQGGERTGTMLASTQQQLIGAVQLYKHAATRLEDIGILDPSKVHKAGGGRLALDPGALKETDLFRHNTAQWVWSVLLPALKAHGYDTMDKQLGFVASLGLRQTVQGFLAEMIRNMQPDLRDVQNIKRAAQVDQYTVQQKTSPLAALNDFKQAWEGLLQTLGAPLAKQAITILHALTDGLLALEKVAADHPLWTKYILDAAGALSLLAIAAGTLAIGTAAASALAVLAGPVGLIALAGGLTALGAAVLALPPSLFKSAAKDVAAGAGFGALLGAPFGPLGIGVGAGIGAAAGYGYYELGNHGVPAPGSPNSLTAAPAVPATPHSANGPTGSSSDPMHVTMTPSGTPYGPIPVIVTNGKDLAQGVTKHQADKASRGATGSVAPDVRVSPDMPGFAAGGLW